MSDYLADDLPIDSDEFTRRACDPRGSAVVEACAGSGKTWLLVSRIVRLLLAGVAPGEILAITFTRRAAQEMRTRLLADLQHLARADEDTICDELRRRGLPAEAAREAVEPARHLYERVATARVPLAVETFHGWFWQLVTNAPLGAKVPYAPALLDAAERLRTDAWLHFSARLVRGEHAAERAAWGRLIDDVGEDSARRLLMQFLHRRAEWWSFCGGDPDSAVRRALAPLRAAGDDDPRRQLRAPAFVAAMRELVALWYALAGSLKTAGQAAARGEQWLEAVAPEPALDFRAACDILLTRSERTPVVALLPERVSSKLATGDAVHGYGEAHRFVVGRLGELRSAHRTWRALKLNEDALACGALLVDAYQRLKARQQALDFTDLEWHAYRLLADPDCAAYMQSRLDARYRHLLIDEFQDTNPLQWQVLQSWLAAYGESDDAVAADRPCVFIVGDPKQSIYRFRRAEPRVFDAACTLLRRDFAAVHLRTNVTRRSTQALVDVLNLAMAGNPLFQAQSTRAAGDGAFVLLPLTPAPAAPLAETCGALRDVLTVPRAERDSDTRYREGRLLADEIARQVSRLRVQDGDGERSGRFADVLLLVRRRTHLAEYERALRDAGLPFVSDRGGGLLATLEADDLVALLGFLVTPTADLKLAHALRSPIFSCGDDDLIELAASGDGPWWRRLQRLGDGASAALKRARELLSRWHDLAGVLPVHDLLDRIYFEGDARRRYAAVVPAALHAQTQANLDAFVELALAIDAGRYPSLPRFIDELSALKRHAAEDAPDEGAAEAGDALRVMTIHGAKGLEGEIVVLADTHVRATTDGESVLVAWPAHAARPEHLSLVARGVERRDEARAAWFADVDAQRAQEDWNLLYVAATRAKQALIVAGSAPARGSIDETWYTRLQAAAALSQAADGPPCRPRIEQGRWVHDFRPRATPTGVRKTASVPSEAQRLGEAWHALLEAGDAAAAEAIARRHRLSRSQRALIAQASVRVHTSLPQFFADGSRAEVELVDDDGEVMRVDRLVDLEDALWIVDFKWRVTDAERAQYEAQVRRYARVLRQIRSDKPVRTALVTAQAELIEIGD